MDNVNTGIYVRVSTEEQAQHGFSVRAQIEKLTYYCEKIKNWVIFDIYIDEGISGKNIKERPSLIRMIDDIKNKKVNNVLVFKIDRLTRSTKDLIDLIELFNMFDCDFNSLNESIDTATATGRMFVKIIGIFAEFERENIVERVKLGIDRKVKEGYTLSTSVAPYGYNRPKGEKTLIIKNDESIIVKKIFDLFLKNVSIEEIVNYLIFNNIKTKKNRKWTYKTVKLILTNSTYIGKVRHGLNTKEYYENDGYHDSIVSDKDFYLVQEKIKKEKITDAYFSHILKCCCGSDMVPKRIYKTNKKGIKKVYINYRCKNKKEGCNRDISHKKLNDLMNETIINWYKLSDKKKYLLLRKKYKYLTLKDNKLFFVSN